MRNCRPVRLALAAIVILTTLAYLPAIRSPFLFDDRTAIAQNSSIETLSLAALHPPAGSPLTGRPVVNLSFAFNHALNDLLGIDQRPDPDGPDKTVSYHVVNLALHLACGLLLFGIIRRTLAVFKTDDAIRSDATAVALVIAALWLVHPIQTDAVDYLTQRTEVLASFFYLATLYASIRAWDVTNASERTRWFLLGVLSCLLGMGSKEIVCTAPLVVLLYDRAFRVGSWRELLAPAYRGRRWF